jgi:hypothetical protein
MGTGIRGVVVCVNYCDLLKITLPRNMKHLDECVVVTSPEDIETQEFCAGIPNVRVFQTDAFTRFGAKFNKGLALEESFDFLGRHGWILIWDADTLFPDDMGEHVKVSELNPHMMYGAPRVILKDPSQWTPDFDWNTARRTLDRCYPGFFQLFHADDPHIAELPWYDVTFNNAGGGDGYFDSRWPWAEKMKFPFVVLHLGERDANWFGRATKRADGKAVPGAAERQKVMEEFLASKGWGRPWSGLPFEDHVQVPGVEPSPFKLRGAGDG